MAFPKLQIFVRQTKALTKKTFFILAIRRWFTTLLQAFLIPLGILLLVFGSRFFGGSGNQYGVGDPAPIKSLRSVLSDGHKFVVVMPDGIGADAYDAVAKISAPLADVQDQLLILNSTNDVEKYCVADTHGVSNCHSVLVFEDSPLTEDGPHNKTWSYTIRTDPARAGHGNTKVFDHDSDAENYFLPLQLAVDNAITNSTDVPNIYKFTRETKRDSSADNQNSYMVQVIHFLAFAFFTVYLAPIFHVVTVVSTERKQGLSRLIDAMGGSTAARVYSQAISFGILYLPLWIISGILFQYFVYTDSNVVLVIGWQVLTGWAMTTASLFGASFFRSNRVSGICVALGFIACAAGAVISVNKQVETGLAAAYSAFFPAMNFIFSLSTMARHQLVSSAVDLSLKMPPGVNTRKSNAPAGIDPQQYHISLGVMWAFLVLQIIFYPPLTILVEKMLHGINTKRRLLYSTVEAEAYPIALEIQGLQKVYNTPWYKTIFGKGKEVRAVDGLDLTARKNQIMCLLGVNGSGKTTTLDLIAGFQRQTAGEVKVNVPAHKLGVCPQKNVLFGRLTVLEHVKFWRDIKGGTDDNAALDKLVDACDLTRKAKCQARYLSGGQKRKLQLACTFAGGSSVCVMDEATSGLDPLSRRVIWDIILAERSKRSIIFTTHFLDEGEVLSDHIVVMSQGQIKCQGSITHLKNTYGGGYRVHIPDTEHPPEINIHGVVHQDRIIYTTPDSASAAQLISRLEDGGQSDVQIAGPTIEDVFLNLTDDISQQTVGANAARTVQEFADDAGHSDNQPEGARDPYSFIRQVMFLVRKRFTILPRYWIAPVLCLLIPMAITPQLKPFLEDYERPNCTAETYTPILDTVSMSRSWPAYEDNSACLVGPDFASNEISIYNFLKEVSYDKFHRDTNGSTAEEEFYDEYTQSVHFEANLASFKQHVETNRTGVAPFGLYLGDYTDPATIAWPTDLISTNPPMEALNLLSQLRSGLKINVATQQLGSLVIADIEGLPYILFACVLLAVYPAFFALYPAYEKTQKIRALQYSNGVRPLPLWTAHLLFDSIFVAVISLVVTCIISSQFGESWFGVWYLLPVLYLYGLGATLMSYIMAVKARSQLAAFIFSIGLGGLQFALVCMTWLAIQGSVDPAKIQSTTDGVSFGLGVIFPIMNVFKAMTVGLNVFKADCRDTKMATDASSIFAYSGPISILCAQIALLLNLLILVDRDLNFSTIFKITRNRYLGIAEAGLSSNEQVSHEAKRVVEANEDLLSAVHVTKTFGDLVAVDDVCLGLGEGETLALLGPNGAGKTTFIDMIRAEMKPDSGNIYLKNVDVHRSTRLAQRSLGVCPQFDALDLMTARQHLEFYARIRGVRNVKAVATSVLSKVGLTEHASQKASKLSGGNKRKLSLGIALMGNPDVLLLDEPSSSMDAAAKRVMWKTLEEIAPGRSLLITTHSMEEADALATRAAIISKRLLAIGTTQSLRERYSNLYHVQLVLQSAPTSSQVEMELVREWLEHCFDTVTFEGQSLGGQIKFTIPNTVAFVHPVPQGGGGALTRRKITQLIETLEVNKEVLGLADYSIGAPTLEKVFLSVVKDNELFEEDRKKKRWWSFSG